MGLEFGVFGEGHLMNLMAYGWGFNGFDGFGV